MNKLLKGALIAAVTTLGYFVAKELAVKEVENTLKDDEHVDDTVINEVVEKQYISIDEIIFHCDASQFSPKSVHKICSISVAFKVVERIYFAALGCILSYFVHSIRSYFYVAPCW